MPEGVKLLEPESVEDGVPLRVVVADSLDDGVALLVELPLEDSVRVNDLVFVLLLVVEIR